MHPDKVLLYLALYPWLAALPALGAVLCLWLWRGIASPDDPAQAATARTGFIATGLAYVALLLVLGPLALGGHGVAFHLPAGLNLTLPSSVLLMGCVLTVLAASFGLALIASNTGGRVRTGGVLLSLTAVLLAGLLGFVLFSVSPT